MQLHAFLLLFIITTDKTLASNKDCGGNIGLDQEPYGHINLALFTDSNTLGPINPQPNQTIHISTCMWMILIPSEKYVLLKSPWMRGGGSLSVHCSWNDQPQILDSGLIALLSDCDNNNAVLTWKGTRRSSNVVQLSYYVQDDERNSLGDRSNHHPIQDFSSRTQKETTSTSATPAGQEWVRVTAEERGHVYEGLEATSVLQLTLRVSSEDSGLPRPTSVQQGPPVSVSSDRETLALPEEKANNGADTSGAAHLTDTVTAADRAHPYSAATTEVSAEITDSPNIRSDTPTKVSKNTEKHIISHTEVPPTSLSPSLWEDVTFTESHSEAAGETPSENQTNSRTSLRSTDEVKWDPTSSTSLTSSKSFTDLSSNGATMQPPFTSLSTDFSRAEAVSHHPHGNVLPIPGSSTQSPTNLPQTSTKINNSPPSSTEPMKTKSSALQSVQTSTVAASPEATTNHGGTSDVITPFSTSLETRNILKNQTSATYLQTTAPALVMSSKDPSAYPQTHTALADPLSTTFTFSLDKSTTYTTAPPHKQPTTHLPSPPSSAGAVTDDGDKEGEFYNTTPEASTTKIQGVTLGTLPPLSPDNQSGLTSSALTTTLLWNSTNIPKFYIMPDQLCTISVDSFELLMQIVVEESRSAVAAGLEEDTAAWVEPYLQRAPGFSRLLGVWSSGHAVQSLVEFQTSGALQWLSRNGASSLLELTGLSLAVGEGRTFRSSKITNITVGGLQSDVCEWLLQCPTGYKCVSQAATSNYSCSSVCHFDHCHHHGMCTHHPGQPPVCRCLVGEDFWYMGPRCDLRMTKARLVGACLAVFVIAVTIVGVLAFVAVRRYKAILIQAKVDQTRSSYRRFNHFDELSGRFWLRSWAESADSLDNPAFTRSDELLHLRALDRPCCYHDDTLSLASTCASHGTRINTIYPNSSQYGWRGSTMSVADGVLDSGKASDLSVCSWPVEPIHWTPFPLLQQLASHRTTTVRMSRPRSYCEGMELMDLGKSWTA